MKLQEFGRMENAKDTTRVNNNKMQRNMKMVHLKECILLEI